MIFSKEENARLLRAKTEICKFCKVSPETEWIREWWTTKIDELWSWNNKFSGKDEERDFCTVEDIVISGVTLHTANILQLLIRMISKFNV